MQNWRLIRNKAFNGAMNMAIDEAMKKENAIKNMELAVEQVFRVIVL